MHARDFERADLGCAATSDRLPRWDKEDEYEGRALVGAFQGCRVTPGNRRASLWDAECGRAGRCVGPVGRGVGRVGRSKGRVGRGVADEWVDG